MTDGANRNQQDSSWAREYWSALSAHQTGPYINFLMDEGYERIRQAYGSNYDRLVALKRRYDPTDLFRLNQNVTAR